MLFISRYPPDVKPGGATLHLVLELTGQVSYSEDTVSHYVVGDIHGCLAELTRLLEALPLKAEDKLIFLGDYVDRGPDSKEVVSYLLDLQDRANHEMIFLKGNHEDMLMAYLGLQGKHGDMFLFNGGWATLASYGITGRNSDPKALLSMMPDSHLEFFKRLNIYHIIEPFLCVHGGIHPKKALEEQIEDEMLWIRDEFIWNSHRLPYTVLFGHTPLQEVLFQLPYKIGLDTGLVYGNTLSCLETTEKVLYQITKGTERVQRKSVKGRWEQLESTPVP